MKILKQDFINQFRHFWKTFEKIVLDFNKLSWIQSGFGLTTPAKTAYHIIKSTKYYIADQSPIVYQSGKSMTVNRNKIDISELPSIDDIVFLIPLIKENTEKWLLNINLEAENNIYIWTGKTMFSVVLFLLRHSQYHLGEMNALLNEYKKGKAEDHFVKTNQNTI